MKHIFIVLAYLILSIPELPGAEGRHFKVSTFGNEFNFRIIGDHAVELLPGDYGAQLVIPAGVEFEGELYIVTTLGPGSLAKSTIVSVTVPHTVTTLDNPFGNYNMSASSIETVDFKSEPLYFKGFVPGSSMPALKEGKDLYAPGDFWIDPGYSVDSVLEREALLAVKDNYSGMLGFASYEKLLVPFEYEEYGGWISYDGDGLELNGLIVRKNGRWGAIDFGNREIIPFRYNDKSKVYPQEKFAKGFLKKYGTSASVEAQRQLEMLYEAQLPYLKKLCGYIDVLSDRSMAVMDNREWRQLYRKLMEHAGSEGALGMFKKLFSRNYLHEIDSLLDSGYDDKAVSAYRKYASNYGYSSYIEDRLLKKGISENVKKDTVDMQWNGNSRYSGQIDGFGLPHGKGVLVTHEYERQDNGIFYIMDTEKKGLWVKGLQYGESVLSEKSGYSTKASDTPVESHIILKGDFAGDTPVGTLDLVMDMQQDEGIIKYNGQFSNGDFNGKGLAIWADGIIYDGEWEDGIRQGYGKLIFPDGSYYEGDFVAGNFEGRGKHVDVEGNIYEGEFINDKYNGQGKVTYSDGGICEGLFEDDMFISGRVHAIYDNGIVYDGEYSNGDLNGKGTMTYPEEGFEIRKLSGYFKDGEYWGECELYFRDGTHETRTFGEASFLEVNGESSLSQNISGYGETKSYTVDTDWSGFEVTSLPSWVELASKDDGGFTLNFRENASGQKRSGYFNVISDELKVRVDLVQSVNPDARTGNISNSWIVCNAERGYGYAMTRGLEIHVTFDVGNLYNRNCQIAAYFEFSDGTVLKDFNNSYRATDGQVAVSSSFIPQYENTHFGDFVLYIPYTELHLAFGQHSLRYRLIIFDMATGKEVCRSGDYDFSLQLVM